MNCKECGKEITGQGIYSGSTGSLMEALGLCYNCAYWTEKVEIQEKSLRPAIIDGCHYLIAPEARCHRGLGGAYYKIRFLADGEIVETTNLWVQGDIPKHFRDRLPNNAEFVRCE